MSETTPQAETPSPSLDSEHLRFVLGLKLRSLRLEKGKVSQITITSDVE